MTQGNHTKKEETTLEATIKAIIVTWQENSIRQLSVVR